MSDIVKRLRDQADDVLDPGYPYYGTPELVREAADEITRLRAERDALLTPRRTQSGTRTTARCCGGRSR